MNALSQISLFEAAPYQQDLADDLRDFSHNGELTIIEERYGVPFFFNEFWTAKQRQGHALQEVSYRACFKPQLPEFFISRLTAEGGVVYDPFMGRGTTPLQAVLMGRVGVGNDINPLSVYLTRPRADPPTMQEIATRLDEIDWHAVVGGDEELLVFYHPDTLAEIKALKLYLSERERSGELDRVDDWIRMVAINRLTGHSTGFFSVYSLPPNQAVSLNAQRKINEKRNQTPPRRAVPDIILKKSKGLLKDGVPPRPRKSQFVTSSADSAVGVADGSVDLVVTSPPFLDIVQYASDNWLRCWFANVDVGGVPIAMHKKPEQWRDFVRGVFGDLARVVKPGGHVCFEVGEVRNGKVELEALVLEAMEGLPFTTLGVLVNVQEFTKTANCWGVSNNAKGTNTNRIVIAQRQ